MECFVIKSHGKPSLVVITGLYLAFIFIPLLSATEYSFKTNIKGQYTFANYRWVFDQPEFLHYIFRSVWLSALSVLVTLAFLIPLQTWLHITQSNWRRLVETVSLLPLIIPVVTLAIGAQVAMPMWVQDSVFELPFFYSMLSLPYTYRAIDIGLNSSPIKTFYEASRVNGGSWIKTIQWIVLPNIKNSVLAASALGFALCIGEFTLTSLLHWDTFPTWINDVSQDTVLGAITLSVISLVIPIILISIFAIAITKREKTHD